MRQSPSPTSFYADVLKGVQCGSWMGEVRGAMAELRRGALLEIVAQLYSRPVPECYPFS